MKSTPVTRFAHPIEVVKSEPLGRHFVCLSLKSHWVTSPFWLPGQYVMVDGERDGLVERKCFTPIAAAGSEFNLLIRRTDGWFNTWLCDIKPGTILRMSGATGKQKLVISDRTSACCFAFDSGISFGISLFRYLGAPPATVYWSATDTILNDLSVISDRFEIPIRPFDQTIGTITEPSLLSDRQIFLSGDGRMIAKWESLLHLHGLDRARIRHEIYYNHREYTPA